LGIVVLRPRKRAPIFAALSLALIISFLLHRTVLADESGNRTPIVGHGGGYWLWFSSAVVALLTAIVAAIAEKRAER
jgi:hypothetical protein